MKRLLLICSLLFLCTLSFAQKTKNKTPVITRTFYYYSFTGVQNEQQLSQVESEITSLKFVEGVKTKYKPEKQAAQVIVTVAIENSGSEERKDFSTAQLKQILLKNNFTPGDLTIREEEKP